MKPCCRLFDTRGNPSLDHRFRADFEPAPEPGTGLLVAVGLGLLYRSRRRRT